MKKMIFGAMLLAACSNTDNRLTCTDATAQTICKGSASRVYGTNTAVPVGCCAGYCVENTSSAELQCDSSLAYIIIGGGYQCLTTATQLACTSPDMSAAADLATPADFETSDLAPPLDMEGIPCGDMECAPGNFCHEAVCVPCSISPSSCQ